MLALERIDNLDILCKDVGTMVDFYHGTLGLPFFLPSVPEEGWASIEAGSSPARLSRSTAVPSPSGSERTRPRPPQ